MPHTEDDFIREGIPVGDFFHSMYYNFYWYYEESRNQRQDVFEAPAAPSEINREDQSVWGLDLSEASGPPAVDIKSIKDHILYAVLSQARTNRQELMNFYRGSWSDRELCANQSYRNLSNAWRDEYALCRPINGIYEDRMLTAEWKIVMCYYVLYKSASAIIHTKEKDDLPNSHVPTLNRHANEFMSMSDTQCLYVYPFNFRPSDSRHFHFKPPYPIHRHFPEEYVEQHLQSVRERFEERAENWMEVVFRKAELMSNWDDDRVTDTYFHVMKFLREWANYQHGGVFARLYGDGYRKAIDRALQLLAFSSLVIAETAIISSFGIDRMRAEVDEYLDASLEGVPESSRLILDRMAVYERVLDDF